MRSMLSSAVVLRRRAALWVAGLLLAGGIVATPCVRAGQEPSVRLLADFNDPARNAARRDDLDGPYQAWMLNPECRCVQTLVADDALGIPGGQALQLDFAVTCPPYFNGWFMFLSPEPQGAMDWTAYDRLGFFMRGNSGFALELKDLTSKDDGSPKGVAQYTLTRVSARWQQVEVPFSSFVPKSKTPIEWGAIRQLVIVFSDLKSSAAGQVAIDRIYVSKGPAAFPAANAAAP